MKALQDRSDEQTVVTIRLAGELATKTPGIRRQFHRRLVHNLRDALERRGVDADIKDRWHRLDVLTSQEEAAEIASRVFGVQGARLAKSYRWESPEEIVALGERQFHEEVPGKTFAVRTRRTGHRDQYGFDSMEIDRRLGSRLVEAGGSVDLDDHQVRVGVEVRPERVFFFAEEQPGAAGLPCGVEGRALGLMSGGFDSAVAIWQMMRRGVDMDFLFFKLAGPPQLRAVQEVSQLLCRRWAHGYAPRLHVVDLRPMLAEMRHHSDGKYWQLLLKRLMVRAGAQIAREKRYPALVTGESCGQVSSQTLKNMAAVGASVPVVVFRPLVGMNKEEIIERAKAIGTYDRCRRVPEFCALDGGPPVVEAWPEELDEQEERLDSELLSRLVKDRREEPILDMAIDEDPQVEIDRIPEGAVVMDLRSEEAFERWSVDGAINMPLERAVDQVGLLPKEGIYLFYCEVGLKSAYLAEAMSAMGYDAYSFRGGTGRLKKWVNR